MPRHLYARLILLVAVILCAAFAAFGWRTGVRQTEIYEQATKMNQQQLVTSLAETVTNFLLVEDYAGMEGFIHKSASREDVLAILVCEPDGKVLAAIEHQPDENPVVVQQLGRVTPPDGPGGFIVRNGNEVSYWQKLSIGRQLGWMKVSFSQDILNLMRRDIWKNTIILALVWIGVASLLVALVMQAPIKAIQHLSDFARKMVWNKGETVAVGATSMEIRSLEDSLNFASRELLQQEEAIRRLNLDLENRVLERTVQLETANQELESFSYSLSHDLRAPLRRMKAFSSMLQEEHGQQLKPEGAFLLEKIFISASRMEELIDDMLQLSRLALLPLNRVTLDLTAMANEVLQDLMHTDPERVVDIKVADGLRIFADPVLMRGVIENLLGNAWKYTGKVAQAMIEVGETTVDGKHCFFIRDNGAGFDMKAADKLFNVFQRLHRVEDFEGTGVGLASVKRIIARHGGQVWAEAEEGKGATFYFYVAEMASADA